MKKLLSLVLIAIMLLSTLVLTSCDSETIMQIVQSIMQDQGNPAPKEVRYTITEEEWNAVLEATNFTFIHRLPNTDSGELQTRTIKKTENAMEILYANQSSYYAMVDGKTYHFYQDGDEWKKQSEDNAPEIATMTFNYLFPMGSGWAELYGKLEYDEEKKCYFAVDSDVTAEFYFEDGQLVYGDVAGQIQFKDFGKTVVNLPDFSHLFTE